MAAVSRCTWVIIALVVIIIGLSITLGVYIKNAKTDSATITMLTDLNNAIRADIEKYIRELDGFRIEVAEIAKRNTELERLYKEARDTNRKSQQQLDSIRNTIGAIGSSATTATDLIRELIEGFGKLKEILGIKDL